jgi:hypothetical protein
MRWWIFALFLCGITVGGHYLSLRLGHSKFGIGANLALALATMAVILAAMVFYIWQ